jgi:hypothetical protein
MAVDGAFGRGGVEGVFGWNVAAMTDLAGSE